MFRESLSGGFPCASKFLRKYENSKKIIVLEKKQIIFHKYFSTAFSHAISAKFALEQEERNSTWEMWNAAVSHISVALNINIYKVKGSKDTKTFRSLNFKESGPS